MPCHRDTGKTFVKLNGLLEKTVEKLPGLMIPVRVKGIRNRTAVNFKNYYGKLRNH